MRTKTKTKTWENVRRTARRMLPVAALAFSAVCSIFGTGNANAATTWGPSDRATFTWEKPASYVTFNSITDNPTLGDERNFVRVKKVGTEDNYRDSIDLEVGAEYEVFIYYHNNASANLNESGKGIATNVRLFVDQPNEVIAGHAGEIKGTIHSAEGDPQEVWDTAYVHTTSTVLLRYVANSATIHTNGSANGTVLDSSALFGDTGAYLAYSTNHIGVVPGCNEYSGYVTYRFKVDQPAMKISKTVSEENQNNFVEKITVKPGAVLDFKVSYQNTGTINQLSIKAHDVMPNGLNYIKSSSYFTASFNEEGGFVSDKLFEDGGINLGDFRPGESMDLTYKVEVADDKTIFPCGDTVVYNNASIASANGTGYDKVEITVHRDCMPEELPKTGPTEIVMALIVVAGIGVGGAYYIASRRQLNKISSK